MADSPHQDLVELAITRIAALSLTGISTRVVEREPTEFDPNNLQNLPVLPCVLVSREGIISPLETRSCSDATAYPLLVRTVDRGQLHDLTKSNRASVWRRTITRAFHHKRLSMTFSGADNFDIVMLPGPTVEAQFLAYDLIVRPIIFECHVDESRP